MSSHPYQSLPDWNFWKPSIADRPFEQVDPVVVAKFRIKRSDKIVTAGSCFAQHIARHLQGAGFNYLVTELPNPIVPVHIAERFGYGVFTARYGNIYTSRQLIQLLQRAYDLFRPEDDVWLHRDGRFIDPFRPRIQPDGFASIAEYRADRRQHFSAVRRAIEDLDVFVFTLGLTEGWTSRTDGAAYPLCPGVAGGSFDENQHVFTNLRVHEVISDLKDAVELIRTHNPSARFIFTVSPVPLVATAEPQSVLVSTTYSKAVLRVAAAEVANDDDRIAYFPSYEVITGPHTRGRYFAEDLRSITEDGVLRVMQLFFQHCTENTGSIETRTETSSVSLATTDKAAQGAMAKTFAVMCDEIVLAESRSQHRAVVVPAAVGEAEKRLTTLLDAQQQTPLVENERVERKEEQRQLDELRQQLKTVSGDRNVQRWLVELLQRQVNRQQAEIAELKAARIPHEAAEALNL
jgi:hypothetical protein